MSSSALCLGLYSRDALTSVRQKRHGTGPPALRKASSPAAECQFRSSFELGSGMRRFAGQGDQGCPAAGRRNRYGLGCAAGSDCSALGARQRRCPVLSLASRQPPIVCKPAREPSASRASNWSAMLGLTTKDIAAIGRVTGELQAAQQRPTARTASYGDRNSRRRVDHQNGASSSDAPLSSAHR